MSNEEAVIAPESTPPDRRSAILNQVLIVLGFVGIFIAGFLSFAHAKEMVVPCSAGSTDCARVESDPMATLFGVYVANYGLAAYLILTGLSIARGYLSGREWSTFTKAGMVISGLGTLFSFFLTFFSMAVIRATCIWCISSALTMAAICGLHYFLLNRKAPETPFKPPLLAAGVGMVLAVGLFGGFYTNLKTQLDGQILPVDLGEMTMSDLVPRPEKIMGGGADAPVLLIEFADYNCPACRASFPHVEEAVKAAGPKLGYAFRAFPLYEKEGHESSLSASLIGEYAADQGKYFDWINEAFSPENSTNIKDDSGLKIIAGKVKLNLSDVQAVLDNTHPKAEAYLDAVSDDRSTGISAGVTMTPTFIVFAEGAKPVSVPHTRLAELFATEPYKSLLQ